MRTFFSKTFLVLLTFSLCLSTTFGQSPNGMSYQAVIRNSSDALVSNHAVGMKISILQGSASGTAIYVETQTPTTNANGLVSIEIGSGAGFNSIVWSAGPYFIKTETDPTGGTNYTITGTNQLLSVPYALHSKTAETLIETIIETDPVFTVWDKDYNDLINQPTIPTVPANVSAFANDAGYLTSFTETDPIFTSSQSANITASDITNLGNLSGINTGDQDITGIATNATAISTIQNEQTTQNTAIALNTAKKGQADGTAAGQMQYWNGTAWVTVSPGTTGQALTYCNGVPTWGPCLALPSLTTAGVSAISQSSATSGGNVTADGGSPVTSRGVCWSTSANPTTANTSVASGSGIGSFTSSMTGLTHNTTYYVRSYATNSVGTAYGDERSFTTLPTGPILGSFTDTRDANVYQTVAIGNQVWMAENLKYLPSVVGSATGSNTIPYYYVYGYNGTNVIAAKATSNYSTYGVLYNWAAAMAGSASSVANPSGVQGVCPTGWHLPSDAEWTSMENFLIANGYNYDGTTTGNKIAKSLASATLWNYSSHTGSVGNSDYSTHVNMSGFTALPGGNRGSSGAFYSIGGNGVWWSATENGTYHAWGRSLSYDYSDVSRYNYIKEAGISVRCVRD